MMAWTVMAAIALLHPPDASLTAVLKIIQKHGGSAYCTIAQSNGLRGLVTTRAADPGDVLMEVPLECCFSDFGAEMPVTIEPPAFSVDQTWDSQLACTVLTHRHSSPLLSTWPKEPPPQPMNCDPRELALVCDESISRKVRKQRARCEQLYEVAKRDAEAAGCPEAVGSAQDFADALTYVWSRSFLINSNIRPKVLGSRRMLCPVLDLANHDEKPTAAFRFMPTWGEREATRGGVIRLHATRRLDEGEAITIRYTSFTSDYAARYYGFVPAHNERCDELLMPLCSVLDCYSDTRTGASCWTEQTCESLRHAAGSSLYVLHKLHPSAPSRLLLRKLRSLLLSQPDDYDQEEEEVSERVEGVFAEGEEDVAIGALRAVATAAEAESLRLRKAAAEADTAAANDVLSAAAELLIKLRDSRIRLLSELAVSMREVAAQFEQPGEADAARKKLEALLADAEDPKSMDLSTILKVREAAAEGASM